MRVPPAAPVLTFAGRKFFILVFEEKDRHRYSTRRFVFAKSACGGAASQAIFVGLCTYPLITLLHHPIRFLALTSLLLLPLCAVAAPPSFLFPDTTLLPPGPNIIRVPFTLSGGLITIQARVDTLEGNFFFDTGASKLLLNQRYFGKKRDMGTGSRGVTGNVAITGTVKVDTLQFDNFIKTKVQADLLDFSHIEKSKKMAVIGLIGASVFEDYEILFDYEASLIVMIKTDKFGTPVEPLPTWEYIEQGSVPLKVSEHIAILYLEFAPKSWCLMGLDSGAEQNLLSSDMRGKFLKANFDIRRRVNLKGAGGESLEVLSGMLKNAHLDTMKFGPMATILTKMNQINEAYAAELDGVLGYEFLSQRLMSINLRRRQLTFYVRISP